MGGQTFVNLVSGKLGYESLNQGIGGYVHLDCAIIPLESFRPDKIVERCHRINLGKPAFERLLHGRHSYFAQPILLDYAALAMVAT